MTAPRREILPHEYLTREEIRERLDGASAEYIGHLEEFFGLFPCAGGGQKKQLFMGETIHEALKRFGRNEPIGVRYQPPSTAELRRMMRGDAPKGVGDA